MTTQDLTTAELDILQRYARGGEPKGIAEGTGVDLEEVGRVLALVGFQRGRAQTLLRERDTKARNAKLASVAGPPPAPPPPAAAAPVVTPRQDVEAVLARADAAGGKFATRATRIRTMVDDLRRDLDDQAKVLAAEREVERLRQELAKATSKLRDLKAPPAKPGKVATKAVKSAGPTDIRRWAAANGIECPRMGKIPAAVREAYERRAA